MPEDLFIFSNFKVLYLIWENPASNPPIEEQNIRYRGMGGQLLWFSFLVKPAFASQLTANNSFLSFMFIPHILLAYSCMF